MTDDSAQVRSKAGWGTASLIAAAWIIPLTGFSIWLYYNDETNATWHYHERLIVWIGIGFVGATVLAGVLHRSTRVVCMVVLFGFVGWAFGVWYQSWAYVNIGGGP